MVDLLNKYSKNELLELFNSFSKKGDIHSYFGISDNSSGVQYVKDIANKIGFDLNTYKHRQKRYCLLCGKELKQGQHKFCCSSHAATYNNKKRSKKKDSKIQERINKQVEVHKKLKKEQKPQNEYVCVNCGKIFISSRPHKFCSNECAISYKKKENYKHFLEHPEEFCRGNYIPRHGIRENILKEQDNKCAICGSLPEHNGKPLVFILDHINGDASDNRRENLRMICPNCDSQLDTFKSKNKNSTRRNYWKERIINSINNE